MHIPKTAGTTFTQILKNQYEAPSMFQFSGDSDLDLKKLSNISPDQRDLINIYSGHAPLETGVSEIDVLTTVTFLREPISRVQSFCKHVYEGKSPQIMDLLEDKAFDLDEFLNKGFFELHNLQTKMLIHKGNGAAPLGMSDIEAVNMAVDHLFNKIYSFGIVENFDQSLKLFQAQFNWKKIEYSSVNKSQSSTKLKFEKRHLNRIRELNQLDIEVYQIAKNEFLNRLKSHQIN